MGGAGRGRPRSHGAVLGAASRRRAVAVSAATAAGGASAAVAAGRDTPARGSQDAPERVAELAVEDAVDDRVHRAVDVAEPREHGEDERRHAAGTAQSADQIHREERTPRPHDGTARVDSRLRSTHVYPWPFIVRDHIRGRPQQRERTPCHTGATHVVSSSQHTHTSRSRPPTVDWNNEENGLHDMRKTPMMMPSVMAAL